MSTLNIFHQGFWKLHVMPSNSNPQNSDSLHKSIEEKNDKVVDLNPKEFWKKIAG